LIGDQVGTFSVGGVGDPRKNKSFCGHSTNFLSGGSEGNFCPTAVWNHTNSSRPAPRSKSVAQGGNFRPGRAEAPRWQVLTGWVVVQRKTQRGRAIGKKGRWSSGFFRGQKLFRPRPREPRLLGITNGGKWPKLGGAISNVFNAQRAYTFPTCCGGGGRVPQAGQGRGRLDFHGNFTGLGREVGIVVEKKKF